MTRKLFNKNLELEAERWIGTPFVWNANTRRGADCLGSTMGILRGCRVDVPTGDGQPYESDWYLHDRTRNRFLEGLLKIGRQLGDDEESLPGDIVVFWSKTSSPKVVHSGLSLGGTKFVHVQRKNGVQYGDLNDRQFVEKTKTFVRLTKVEQEVDG